MRGLKDQPAAGRRLRLPFKPEADAERIAALSVGAVYIGTLLLLPWLPAIVVLGASAAAAGAIAVSPLRAAGGWAGGWMAPRLLWAAGVPLHLLVLATGGLASPLVILIAPWTAVASFRMPVRGRITLGALVVPVLIVTDAWARGGLHLAGGVEAVITVALGVGAAELFARLDARATAQERRLSQILDEASTGRGGGEAAEAARRLDELANMLDRIRRLLGAAQAVLWDVDPDRERARPRLVCGGPKPGAVALKGDPLGWSWKEGLPIRLESAPTWADPHAQAVVVAIEPHGRRAALLSLAFAEAAVLPDDHALDDAAGRLRVLLQLQRREAEAVTARERFHVMMTSLRRLAGQMSVEAFARELGLAAIDVSGGTGACVALWENEAGRVLATLGGDGGPEAGAGIGPLDSEMALAARQATTLIRERGRPGSDAFPVATPDERWLAEPASLLVVPLHEAGQAVAGILAVWSTRSSAFDRLIIDILEAVAPYAAQQLEYARHVGGLREDADLASRDSLTGLLNRRAFDTVLDSAALHFSRYRRPLALVMLDVDHFKRINDTYGHEAGDAVLRAVSAAIRGSIRDVDQAARFGGEEFVLLLPETALSGARLIAERLRQRVEGLPVEWNGQQIPVRISLGVSAAPECVADPQDLVASADEALYASKESGRNRVTTAPFAIDSGPGLA